MWNYYSDCYWWGWRLDCREEVSVNALFATLCIMCPLLYSTGCANFGSFLLFRSIPLPKTYQVYFPECSRSPRVAELHARVVATIDSVLLGCIRLLLRHHGTLTVW